MVFSSAEFLFFFLPASIVLYFLTPVSFRNYTLLLLSLIFYAWGGGITLLLLLVSIGFNYLFGRMAAHGRELGDEARVRRAVIACVIVNLALLSYFKYANFFVEQINAAATAVNRRPLTWAEIALPIGISFYTFQGMSYVFDVARAASPALRNPLDFALYISMFPQLIAGPIVRYELIARQLSERITRWDDYVVGTQQFCWGLFKKVVIADSAGEIAAAAFSTPPAELGMTGAWLGLLAYTLQIYFDFSGYSDMAIGLGRIFGFRFPENFLRPYSAVSLTDFWRRWHITLSSWFRDYVYIPLGGGRDGAFRTYVNLWIVFLATGLWHGASWTFVLWGAYHGIGLVLERLTGLRDIESRSPAVTAVRRALTLFVVMMGWVIFRADTLPYALGYYAALFTPQWTELPHAVWVAASHKNLLVVALASLVFFLPREFTGGRLLEQGGVASTAFATAVICLALPLAILWIVAGSFSAFLYFRF